jgi:hypothetical protein
MRRLAIILSGAMLVTSAVAMASTSAGRLSIKPTRPLVNQSVLATYRVLQQLPRGTHYEAFLAVHTSDKSGRCASFAHRTVTSRPTVGRVLRITFSSSQDKRVIRGTHWCPGSATITIDRDRNQDRDGGNLVMLAKTNFQFTALA